MKLSVPRRIIADLMYFSADVPFIVVQRELVLARAAAARTAAPQRPSWTALFTKAYAIVAQDMPELRRAYVRFPWPHLYEFDQSAGNVAVERSFDGEFGVAFAHIKDPASVPLGELSWRIRNAKDAPLETERNVRTMVRIARLPLWPRRALWWVVFNMARSRANYFGTFGVSTVTALKTDILKLRSPLASVLTYSTAGSDGRIAVRIVFDHRVLDAMTVARALERLERALEGPIADELLAPTGNAAAR